MKAGAMNNSWRWFGGATITAHILLWTIFREMQAPTPNWLTRLVDSPITAPITALIMPLVVFALVAPMVASKFISRWYLLLLISFAGAYVYSRRLGL